MLGCSSVGGALWWLCGALWWLCGALWWLCGALWWLCGALWCCGPVRDLEQPSRAVRRPGYAPAVLTAVIADTVFGTNCYVLATGAGQECLVVDPGFDVLDRLDAVLDEQGLRPAAVLLTHGHADHVWSVAPVCRPRGAGSAAGESVAALVHADDAHRLEDPLASLDPSLVTMLEQRFGSAATWQAPDRVEVLEGAHARVCVAGLELAARHAPGHTEGSVVFTLDAVPREPAGPSGAAVPARGGESGALTSTVLSGDVLFAGSIGRTDLAGGDGAAMERSLREVVLPMPDDRLVLPGHGPATTVARERATNPYLLALAP